MARVTYTIKSGDTLSKIANSYKSRYYSNMTTIQICNKIKSLNPSVISDINYIRAGDTIVIYDDTGTSNTETPKVTLVPYGVVVGPQADDERTLIATWKWAKEADTDHYLVRWWYGTTEKDEGKGILDVEDARVSTAWKGHIYNAPNNARRVSFYVKPVAKVDRLKDGTEVARFTNAGWSTKVTYLFDANEAITPDAPDVQIEYGQLTATLDNLDMDATHIRFKIIKNNDEEIITELIPIKYGSVSYTCAVEPGNSYKVCCQAVRDGNQSGWSDYSTPVETVPTATGNITVCRPYDATTAYLEWPAVPNASSYEVQYTDNKDYFDVATNLPTETVNAPQTSVLIQNISGSTYYFRVRACNGAGKSAWSEIVSLAIGKKPSAPTTWSSTTTAVSGDPLYLYWVHNSEDGSKQTGAKILLTIDGIDTEIVKEYTPDPNTEETIYVYDELDTSVYNEGIKIIWKVCTKGVTADYSDWSTPRTIDIYGKPELVVMFTDEDGTRMSILESFPFVVKCASGPKTQTPIGYHLSIVSEETYETVDRVGNNQMIKSGQEVYSRFFDVNANSATSDDYSIDEWNDLFVTLSANDIDLENNVEYTVHGTVTMDSGLTATGSKSFTVGWDEDVYIPDAEIGISKDSFSAVINPYCEDPYGKLRKGVTLSVYRREFNGRFVEIATNLRNSRSTFVVDPHPALDYARYRIVARDEDTGAIGYSDTMTRVTPYAGIIIQWDEQWSNFDVTEDGGMRTAYPWSGSMLRLLYNIDVSESNKIDVALVEYAGREHPVSYYGTQLGYTATWKVDIPATDKETLYALRKLAAWTGNAYVREPSGTGYWATVAVSFNIDHLKVVVPVTLTITRVEGGV